MRRVGSPREWGGWQFGERKRRDVQCSERVVEEGEVARESERERKDEVVVKEEEEKEEEEKEEAEEAGSGRKSFACGREPSGPGFSVETSGMDKLWSDCPRG